MQRFQLFSEPSKASESPKASEITVLKQFELPMSQNEITTWLRDLREHCHIKQSHFAVSSVVETRCGDQYIYAGGVNVENDDHNKLGMHGEQNALVTLQSVMGGSAHFSKIWIMAAPESVVAGSNDPLADNFALSCGHCRQILLSFSQPDSVVYSVSCNGAVSGPYDLKEWLPGTFNEGDLNIQKVQESETRQTEMIALYRDNFLIKNSSDPTQIIFDLFSQLLKPHIIDLKFVTSPIFAVMFKLTNGCYIPGVLVQDIAFLTTDAIFAALGHAITRFGATAVHIEEIHLYGKINTDELSLLTGSELGLLRKFGDRDTPVFSYAAEGLIHKSTLANIAKHAYEKDFGCLHPAEEKLEHPSQIANLQVRGITNP